jgi:hypothetical protein
MTEELSRLIIEMLDGRLRPAGAARLRKILREDDGAVDAYVRYVGIHALLDWRFAKPLIADDEDGEAAVDENDEALADSTAGGRDVSGESFQGQQSLLGYHYSESGQADEPEPLPSPPVWPRVEAPRQPRWVAITLVSAAAV